MAENKNALPIGTILNARYEIEGLIGGGGFGLVYRAKHTGLNATMAIKELFPRDIVFRQGKAVHPVSEADTAIYQKVLSSFRKEGRRLASLGSCPSIVQCSDYFEENGSGYLVMEYIEGRSLREVVRSYRKNNQTFSEASLITLLNELLKGLKEVHKAGIQHMDIKPENIYVRETEGADELSNPVLLDFGASRSQTGHSTGSNLLVGTVPYAPIEQMHERGDMGPWTDIYALGITLYELMFSTDEIPGCTERMSDLYSKETDPLRPAKSKGTGQYSERFLRLIDKCVAIKAKDRPQNVEEVENLLAEKPLSKPELIAKTSKEKSKTNKVVRLPLIIIISTIAVGIVGYSYVQNIQKVNDPQYQYNQGNMYYYGEGVAQNYEEAFGWYKKAAEQGDADAQYRLGEMYENEEGVAQDYEEAFGWYKKAAEQGDADAQNTLGWMYLNGRGVTEDDQQAVEWFRKAAEQGHAKAQFNLGWMYQNGKGVAQDGQQAVEWYKKAAEQGNAGAQNSLGWMYQNGRGVAQDDRQAVEWYKKAAEQGNANAQNSLGWIYLNGRGVTQDDQQAAEWYRKAAEQGHANAQNNLGMMYEYGQGVAQDYQQAIEWYRKAAEQEFASAQYNLGFMYINGRGVAQDDQQVVEWFRKAAEQGHASAQNNLGWMYDEGRGVAQDYEEAFKWYQKAAEQGYAKAQFNLGMMYLNGRVVAQDDQQAVEWFRKAAEQGHTNAQSALSSINKYQIGETFRDCATCPEMVVVPAGEFMMGTPEEKIGKWNTDERPQHQVTISRPFAVGKYEVTVEQYAEFVRETKHEDEGCGEANNHPVACVSWNDTQAYLEWLSMKTGQNYRLLSESEWEYATRAGTTTAYYFGSMIYRSQANLENSNIYGTTPVGSYLANAFGLYDMHGNVWEWVEDCWHYDYIGAPADGSAWIGECDIERTMRGGSWDNEPEDLRSATRGRGGATFRGSNGLVGFRIARTLTP